MKISRRNFLKIVGASVATLGLGAKFADFPNAPTTLAVPKIPHDSFGMLIDTTKCIGCRQCVLACQKKNNLPSNAQVDKLSAISLTIVAAKNVSTDPNKPDLRTVKRQCMNCINPGCVSACTVGALQKRPDGPVIYDSNRCIGCRYCMYACPFGVPTFEWEKQFALIRKCDECADRIDQGKIPACVEACPVKALSFGKRDDLLTIANERIYTNRDKYVEHVYGENEIGGTSMLYLASVPFEQLGFPALPNEAPAEINATIMHSTPTIAAGMAMALSGIYWLVKRRDEIESQDPYNGSDEEKEGGH